MERETNIFSYRTDTGYSNVIGSEVTIIRDFFKRLFPYNFFKDYWIDTKLFSEEIENEDVYKKDKPTLIIKPKVSLDLDNTVMGRLPDYWYKNYYILRNLKDNYFHMIEDDINKLYLYCLPERMKIDYEISIVLPTRMEMLNTGYFLKGCVLQQGYFYLKNSYMEVEIPRTYIQVLSKKLGYDLSNIDDNNKFEEFINHKSKGRVVRKKKLSINSWEYYFQFNVDILCKFENTPELGDGEIINMVEDKFTITTTFQTEFWSPFNFFLEIGDKSITDLSVYLDDENKIEEKTTTEINQGATEVSVNCTFPLSEIMKKEKAVKIDGKDLVIWQGYVTDNKTVDELYFEDTLLFEMREVIKFLLNKKINIDKYFNIRVYKEKELIPQRYIEIDWENFSLKNYCPDSTCTFYLAIYCDLHLIRNFYNDIRKKPI